MKNCPQAIRELVFKGQAFQMIELDAEATSTVIESMLSISNSFTCDLIDLDVIHFFVSINFAKLLSSILVHLDKTIVTETPARDLLVSSLVYKSCRVKVAGRELQVDLLLLDFQMYDVILGIDWLVAYYVTLDYLHQIVLFHPPNSTH